MVTPEVRLRSELSAFIEEARRSLRPLLVLGASRGGWYIYRVLSARGLKVNAFVDSDCAKHNTRFLDAPVLSPADAIARFPNGILLSGLLNPANVFAAHQHLAAIGARDIRYLMPHLLLEYFVSVASRPCDRSELAASLEMYFGKSTDGSLVLSPSLSCVITEKCTLRCKDCGAFVPENAAPLTYSAEQVVADIRKYCSAFDVVHHIALQGGEPLLHREIPKILQGISQIPNLLFVDFVSNGTLLPRSGASKAIADTGAAMIISDYGAASTRVAQLSAQCERNGIFVGYYRYGEDEWGAQTPILKRNRGRVRNDEIFAKCVTAPMLCCQIMNGKVHRCSFSNFCHRLKLVPEYQDDFVDLDRHEANDPELIKKIRYLVSRTAALDVCDHCPGDERTTVPAGVQLMHPDGVA